MTLGGRKLDLAVFVIAIATVCLWNGKLTSVDYAQVLYFTAGAYIAGNAWQAIGMNKSRPAERRKSDIQKFEETA